MAGKAFKTLKTLQQQLGTNIPQLNKMSHPPGYGPSHGNQPQGGYPGAPSAPGAYPGQPNSGYPAANNTGGYPQTTQHGGYQPQTQQGYMPQQGAYVPQATQPGYGAQQGAYPPQGGAAGYPSAHVPPQQNDPLYGWFMAVDSDRSGHINQSELQQALTQSGICGSFKQFSLETCRLMISMLDSSGLGAVTFNEFKELWNIINGWKNVFVSFDKDRSGSVEVHELDAIVRSMGYNVSQQTINLIAMRHSADHGRRLAFDDFVAAIVKLRALTEEFKKFDQPPTGVITIQYDSFIQLAMKY